jgi:hypothetical protein
MGNAKFVLRSKSMRMFSPPNNEQKMGFMRFSMRNVLNPKRIRAQGFKT